LGSAISDAFNEPLTQYRELVRDLRIKISGCPNGCAQHTVANIGFHAAAMSHDGRTVPAHLLSLGGQTDPQSAQFAKLIGKFPAKNSIKVIETLLRLYEKGKHPYEDFNSFVERTGEDRLRTALEPLQAIPSFAVDPSFYEDYGHENERFAVRPGIKGECAGSTVAETVPNIEIARERLAQAEAFLYHDEYKYVQRTAYEAAAAATRVPLYKRLVDPFTADEALWEFENLFVLSGETEGEWRNVSSRFLELKSATDNVTNAREILYEARRLVDYCVFLAPEIRSANAIAAQQ
jgi:sulfite reductase (ferredoxin)